MAIFGMGSYSKDGVGQQIPKIFHKKPPKCYL